MHSWQIFEPDIADALTNSMPKLGSLQWTVNDTDRNEHRNNKQQADVTILSHAWISPDWDAPDSAY